MKVRRKKLLLRWANMAGDVTNAFDLADNLNIKILLIK